VLPEVTGETLVDTAAAAAEAGSLAAYRYEAFRSGDPAKGLVALVLTSGSAGSVVQDAVLDKGTARGARVAESVALARDLVNEPPSSLTPTRFAQAISDRFAGVAELSVEVWDEERIREEHLGGLLGVAIGSEQPPRLVRVEYRPADPYEFEGRSPHLALVGKGITFDSGG
jgi:leucyl aminopeptidase